jgi:hypothetical protein
MLAVTGGQERTEPEYRALLDKAGFRPARVIRTKSAVSVVGALYGRGRSMQLRLARFLSLASRAGRSVKDSVDETDRDCIGSRRGRWTEAAVGRSEGECD